MLRRAGRLHDGLEYLRVAACQHISSLGSFPPELEWCGYTDFVKLIGLGSETENMVPLMKTSQQSKESRMYL